MKIPDYLKPTGLIGLSSFLAYKEDKSPVREAISSSIETGAGYAAYTTAKKLPIPNKILKETVAIGAGIGGFALAAATGIPDYIRSKKSLKCNKY